MNRYRFALVLMSALMVVAAAGTSSPTDTPAAGSFCNKLCIIGDHCVPTPSGGICVPNYAESATVCTDSTELIAGGSFCNKLCIVGDHCVPTPSGGICVPNFRDADVTPADPAGDLALNL